MSSSDVATNKKVKASQHESYGTFTILAIIIPLAGFILGIVYLTKDKKVDKKLGEHLLALSILFGAFWWIILAMFVFKTSTITTTPLITTTTAPSNAVTQTTTQNPSVSPEYNSALAQADTYASTLHLSKQGVYDQLVSQYGGKFTAPAAQYAIDNVKADWNANALAQAKTYQNDLHLSPAAVHDQLVSQNGGKFTAAEADYAIAHLND